VCGRGVRARESGGLKEVRDWATFGHI